MYNQQINAFSDPGMDSYELDIARPDADLRAGQESIGKINEVYFKFSNENIDIKSTTSSTESSTSFKEPANPSIQKVNIKKAVHSLLSSRKSAKENVKSSNQSTDNKSRTNSIDSSPNTNETVTLSKQNVDIQKVTPSLNFKEKSNPILPGNSKQVVKVKSSKDIFTESDHKMLEFYSQIMKERHPSLIIDLVITNSKTDVKILNRKQPCKGGVKNKIFYNKKVSKKINPVTKLDFVSKDLPENKPQDESECNELLDDLTPVVENTDKNYETPPRLITRKVNDGGECDQTKHISFNLTERITDSKKELIKKSASVFAVHDIAKGLALPTGFQLRDLDNENSLGSLESIEQPFVEITLERKQKFHNLAILLNDINLQQPLEEKELHSYYQLSINDTPLKPMLKYYNLQDPAYYSASDEIASRYAANNLNPVASTSQISSSIPQLYQPPNQYPTVKNLT